MSLIAVSLKNKKIEMHNLKNVHWRNVKLHFHNGGISLPILSQTQAHLTYLLLPVPFNQ